MGILNPPGTADYCDFDFVLGAVGGGALAVDVADPNTTAPQEARICMVPRGASRGGGQTRAFLFADAGCVLEGWVFSRFVGRWVRLFQKTIATAFIGVHADQAIGAGATATTILMPIPDGVPFFLRVQANAGGAVVAGVKFH